MTAATPATGAGPANGVGPAHAPPPKPRDLVPASPATGLAGEILVTRRLGGVALTTRVARGRFRGVILALAGASAPCTILLAFADRTTDLALETADDADAVAHWRRLGSDLGLPLILRRENGEETLIEKRIGGVVTGEARTFRRRKPLARRRPRFLMRRKPTIMPLAPAVHFGRELTATR